MAVFAACILDKNKFSSVASEIYEERQIFAEAVSDEEYELAELCGFQGEEIIFNGPIKTRDGLQNAFNGKSFINLDSKEELAYIEKYHPDISGNLGLRININPNWFHSEDIGYSR